jgi:prepilin-type N-terminal cleavage/methylation domain-containing protein
MRAVQIKIYQKGYTLIELMVAVVILGLGITGSLFLLNQTLRNTSVVKNNFIATYLASEGVEIVRNIRDTNWRDGKVKQDGSANDWRSGLVIGVVCHSVANCGVDFDTTGLQAGVGATFLKFDSGQYHYEGGLNTLFTRKVSVEDLVAPHSLRIVSTISWTEKGIPKSRVIEEHLYNWKEPQ